MITPLVRFIALDVSSTFPMSPEDFARYAARVPSEGRQGVLPSDAMATDAPSLQTQITACDLGVLYLMVLSSPLFRDCGPEQIRDVRWTPPREFVCQNWRQLLAEIVFRLHTYEAILVDLRQEFIEIRRQHRTILDDIERKHKEMSRWYKRKDGRWTLPRGAHASDKRVAASVKTLLQVSDGWVLMVLGHPRNRRYARQRLTESLYEAFVQYGPAKDRTHPAYANKALYAAIFTLLVHCGIMEPGDRHGDHLKGGGRIAYALKKYRQHHTKSDLTR
jgi:hypothetical protein